MIFSDFNLEVIDINTNAMPDIYINKNGVTFTKRVLEDLNYAQNVQYCIDTEHNIFAIRPCKGNQIAGTVIPVIVYHGEEENLPEIFDRINSQGTPLDQYEVYAAAWPVNQRFKIDNTEIVEWAIKKYDTFVEDGYTILGYDRETMRKKKEVNAFEYLFGLSKYIVNKYEILGFQKSLPDDTVNPLGFELVNACLNDTDKIKTLYKNIYDIKNISEFESALKQSIEFVTDSVKPILKFKGNRRSQSKSKMFHAKYQILSMVSTTFKEMFPAGDYSDIDKTWNEKKDMMAKNLIAYYAFDILTNYWSEGGPGKIHAVAKSNRYAMEISPRAWKNALDAFLDKSFYRAESKQIQNPKSAEYVFLNCIYLNTFTAMDQLSIDKFDVEHIAPKEQMKKLIEKTNGTEKGLPISCVANLCYLPEYANRSKKDRNFYQDKKYLKHIKLDEVEDKYSFTTSNDLEWMDMPYDGEEDFDVLKQFYLEFLTNRFSKMKKFFCESMDIDYDAMNTEQEESTPDAKGRKNVVTSHKSADPFVEDCIERVERSLGVSLERVKRKAFSTSDGSKGYVFCSSKAYSQGDREKYWFAFREEPLENIADCEEKYMVYGCKDTKEVLVIPLKNLEDLKSSLNFSTDDDGLITHWHIVFFRDKSGHMTQLLSKPELREIDIDDYKIQE